LRSASHPSYRGLVGWFTVYYVASPSSHAMFDLSSSQVKGRPPTDAVSPRRSGRSSRHRRPLRLARPRPLGTPATPGF